MVRRFRQANYKPTAFRIGKSHYFFENILLGVITGSLSSLSRFGKPSSNNCYGPKLIMAPKSFHIQDIARLLNVGEAFLDLALIAGHLAV